MSDARVRRQGAEIGDISVICKATERVVADRWPEKDLHASIRSSHFEIGFRRMLDHVENRRVAFPWAITPAHNGDNAIISNAAVPLPLIRNSPT